MSLMQGNDAVIEEYQKYILQNKNYKDKPYSLTPFIVTFCESELTSIDIKTFMEMGLKIVRFKMTHVSKQDKIGMLKMIDDAIQWCCDKHEMTTWPITVSIDIPNVCIRTGFLKDKINEEQIELEDNWVVELTADAKYWNKCDTKRIFIDDPYIIRDIKLGTEITVRFGKIVMVCTERIDVKTIKCKVLRGDKFGSLEFVCVRGIRHMKPPLSKIDLDLIAFAKDYKFDIITINSLRSSETLKKIREMFQNANPPLIMSTICEQEGLDNIDEIIENSDAVILAREFLAHEILNVHKMISIQLQIGAKCRQRGKPFYISGNILERTLHKGTITGSDLTDVTNAILQGAGFIFRTYKDTSHVIRAMRILAEISKMVESIRTDRGVWRMIDELKMPVNAAEAVILAAHLAAHQADSAAFIIPTVTGRTAIQLSHIAPEALIMTVSTNPVVARQLQIHRGILPIIYDKPPLKDWQAEIEERIKFAVAYGLKNNILNYGQTYVELHKSSPTSAYCDIASLWNVLTEEKKKNKTAVNHCPH